MKAAPTLRIVRTNDVVPLREGPALPSPSPRTPRRGPLVAGIVLSLAVHAALLVGLRAPRIATEPSPPPVLEVVLVEPPMPVVPPQPPKTVPAQQAKPPERAPVAPRQPRPLQKETPHREPLRPQAAVPPPPVPHEPAPALPPPAPLAMPRAEPPQIAAQPSAPATPGPTAAAPADPAPAASDARSSTLSPPSFNAAYLRNPAPAYPLIARRNGQQGTVTLRVPVTRDGRAGNVTVETSSGSPALDAAALAAVKEWRFVPARQNGQAVDAHVLVPIVFRLRDG